MSDNVLASRKALAACTMIALAAHAGGCSSPAAAEPASDFVSETISVVEEGTDLFTVDMTPRFFGPEPPAAVVANSGDILYMNNELYEGGRLLPDPDGNPFMPPNADWVDGTHKGQSRGYCVRVAAPPQVANPQTFNRDDVARLSKCEHVVMLTGRGTLILSGLFHENAFEHGEPQSFAITGGTGELVGANGEAILTQIAFPGTVTRIELKFWRPRRAL